jgi:hypothetical protein
MYIFLSPHVVLSIAVMESLSLSKLCIFLLFACMCFFFISSSHAYFIIDVGLLSKHVNKLRIEII